MGTNSCETILEYDNTAIEAHLKFVIKHYNNESLKTTKTIFPYGFALGHYSTTYMETVKKKESMSAKKKKLQVQLAVLHYNDLSVSFHAIEVASKETLRREAELYLLFELDLDHEEMDWFASLDDIKIKDEREQSDEK